MISPNLTAVFSNSTPTTATVSCQHVLLWKWAEIILLLICFIIGAPINAHIYQLHRDKTFPNLHRLPPNFRELQKHLNLSDLMVLFIYVPAQLCYQMTEVWRAGIILCKVVKFLENLSFHISSNVIAAIAIDRILKPELRHRTSCSRITLAIVWLSAMLFSSIQLYMWTLVERPTGLQCRTIHASPPISKVDFIVIYVNAYLHFSTMFWGPLLIIVVCYFILFLRQFLPVNHSPDPHNRMTSSATPICPTLSTNLNDPQLLDENPGLSLVNKEVSFEMAEILTTRPSVASTATTRTSCSHSAPQTHAARTLKIAALLVITYCMCWLPYIVIGFVAPKVPCMPRFVHQLICVNSVINPFLYTLGTDLSKIKMCIKKIPTSRF